MSNITIGKAAKILGVNKKTLMRWDESGKFSPKIREVLSGGRVYVESDVRNLKTLREHESRHRRVMKEWKSVINKLSSYNDVFLLTDEESALDEQEQKLKREHQRLKQEFETFSNEIKQLYKQFFVKD